MQGESTKVISIRLIGHQFNLAPATRQYLLKCQCCGTDLPENEKPGIAEQICVKYGIPIGHHTDWRGCMAIKVILHYCHISRLMTELLSGNFTNNEQTFKQLLILSQLGYDAPIKYMLSKYETTVMDPELALVSLLADENLPAMVSLYTYITSRLSTKSARAL